MKRAAALLLCTLPLLGGCVAAAIPVLAGAAVAKKQVDKPRQQTPAPPQEQRVAVFVGDEKPAPNLAPTALSKPEPVTAAPAAGKVYTVTEPASAAITDGHGDSVRITKGVVPASRAAPGPAKQSANTVALPIAPPANATSGGYFGLAGYVLPRASSHEATGVLDVIDAGDPLGEPRRSQCGGLPPAVMIDLDPGLGSFDPARSTAEPGLGAALSALRGAGITVLWSSALPVEKAEAVASALARAGLDPEKTDRLLLLKGPGDRKQARRLSAARNWCVIAMAGDRRGDFDEAFDYLKNPEAVIPADKLFGDGWFLAPAPIP